MPSFNHLVLLSFVGIFGGVANLWLSQSYKYSEVSLVTPLKYLALVFAIIFGYFIWGEIPTIKTLIGAFLVIISTLIIEHVLNHKPCRLCIYERIPYFLSALLIFKIYAGFEVRALIIVSNFTEPL